MAQRKSITKKNRFEVFKRDSFTCQYCGSMAPDVILEIDHINPVSKGGTNEMMNLVTSCKDCNSGKKDRVLGDKNVIKQQQKQLKEINQKREQLKLMLEWKNELDKFHQEQIDIIDDILIELTNTSLTDAGRLLISKNIKKYGISDIIDSTYKSIDRYFDANDKITCEKVISYIAAVSRCKAQNLKDPYFSKVLYVKGIMRNRFGIKDQIKTSKALTELIKSDEDYETIKSIAVDAQNWVNFWELLNEFYEGYY